MAHLWLIYYDLLIKVVIFHSKLLIYHRVSVIFVPPTVFRSEDRWKDHRPSMGTLEAGPYALAKARLLCMARGLSVHGLLWCWEHLNRNPRCFLHGFLPSNVCIYIYV